MRKLSPATQEALVRLVGKAVNARSQGHGRPFIVGHFVTQKCMCSCASCLWKDNDRADVPLDALRRFYTAAGQAGFGAVALTGGEPLLRQDLGELVRHIKEEAGMSILLFNTGWLLKKRMDDVLPYVDMMLVSVDSADPAEHDRIRGLEGLFDRLVEAIGLAKERYPHLAIQLNSCVQKGMAARIDGLVALAERLGVGISFDVITEERHGDGLPFAQTDMGLPLEELRLVCATLLEKKRAGAPIVNSERYFEYFVRGKPGYRCHLPKLVMFVDGLGNVEDCLALNRPIANIVDMPLEQIMDLPRFKQLRADAERCSSCNSPTMVDLSHVWDNPQLVFERGGIALG